MKKVFDYSPSLSHEVVFNFLSPVTQEYFREKWDARTGTEVCVKVNRERNRIEEQDFWSFVGDTIAEDKNLKRIRFDGKIYGDKADMFEEEVLDKIPPSVEIEFDEEELKTPEKKLEQWIQKYNIVYIRSKNSGLANHVAKSFNLRSLWLRNVMSFEAADPLFRKDVRLDSLYLHFYKQVDKEHKFVSIWKDVIKRNFLFPAEITIKYQYGLNRRDLDTDFNKLNERINNVFFMKKVGRKRDIYLKYLDYKILINTITEHGIINQEDKYFISEEALKDELSFRRDGRFKALTSLALKEKYITEYTKRDKNYFVLVNDNYLAKQKEEEFRADHGVDATGKPEDVVPKRFFTLVKEYGFLNETDNYIIGKKVLKKKYKVIDEEFDHIIQLALKKKYIREYKKKKKIFIVLLVEDADVATDADNEGMTQKLVEQMREVNNNSEEGYLYLEEEACLKHLKVDQKRFNEIMKFAEKKEILKRDKMAEKKVIVFIVERLLDTSYL